MRGASRSTPARIAVVLPPEGGDGGGAQVDVSVHAAGEVHAQEGVARVGNGVDVSVHGESRTLAQLAVDALEGDETVVLAHAEEAGHPVAVGARRVHQPPVADGAGRGPDLPLPAGPEELHAGADAHPPSRREVGEQRGQHRLRVDHRGRPATRGRDPPSARRARPRRAPSRRASRPGRRWRWPARRARRAPGAPTPPGPRPPSRTRAGGAPSPCSRPAWPCSRPGRSSPCGCPGRSRSRRGARPSCAPTRGARAPPPSPGRGCRVRPGRRAPVRWRAPRSRLPRSPRRPARRSSGDASRAPAEPLQGISP